MCGPIQQAHAGLLHLRFSLLFQRRIFQTRIGKPVVVASYINITEIRRQLKTRSSKGHLNLGTLFCSMLVFFRQCFLFPKLYLKNVVKQESRVKGRMQWLLGENRGITKQYRKVDKQDNVPLKSSKGKKKCGTFLVPLLMSTELQRYEAVIKQGEGLKECKGSTVEHNPRGLLFSLQRDTVGS